MTKDAILAMEPGKQLDLQVRLWMADAPLPVFWKPSTNITDAWTVVEYLDKRWNITICNGMNMLAPKGARTTWWAELDDTEPGPICEGVADVTCHNRLRARGKTVMEAICKVALLSTLPKEGRP